MLLKLSKYFLSMVPTKYPSIFVWFMTMQEKQILARAIGNQKRKLGVTMYFSEIIKVQFGKKIP